MPCRDRNHAGAIRHPPQAVHRGRACYAGPVPRCGQRGWGSAAGTRAVCACFATLLAFGCAPADEWISYGTSGGADAGPRQQRQVAKPRYQGSIGVMGKGCASLELRAEPPAAREADVVFVIDNSGSMADEIAIVQERMNAFSQQISDADVDAHIVLISASQGAPTEFTGVGELGICIAAPLGSGQCPDDSVPPQYLHLPLSVGSNDSLELLLSTYADWSAGLRPQAETAIVVITDDNAWLPDANTTGQVAESFMEQIAGLDPALAARLRFHGIFARTLCSQAAAEGEVYEQLVRRTGGVAGDLCRRDFQGVFDAVADSVIAGASLGCEWAIPEPPEGEELLFAQVAVRYTPSDTGVPEFLPRVSDAMGCLTADGWYYDDPENPQKVAVCRTTCDRLRNDNDPLVDLVFGCDDGEQPD